MDDDERQHLQDLVQTYQRRLRMIEKQIALTGSRTPPEVQIELEDLHAQIRTHYAAA